MSTQRDAVRVLTTLTDTDLPRLYWRLGPYDGAGLEAQPWGDTDADRLAVLTEWAEHLGAPVQTRHKDKYTQHTVTQNVGGVKVHIFTHTDETHTLVAVPIEQAERGAV